MYYQQSPVDKFQNLKQLQNSVSAGTLLEQVSVYVWCCGQN